MPQPLPLPGGWIAQHQRVASEAGANKFERMIQDRFSRDGRQCLVDFRIGQLCGAPQFRHGRIDHHRVRAAFAGQEGFVGGANQAIRFPLIVDEPVGD